MQITLIRHAQPDWEPNDSAVDEPTLTAHGFEQARCTAEALAGSRCDSLYVSPLRRAQETAAPIAAALGVEPIEQGWLRELELPSLEGRTPDQVQEFFRNGRLRDPESWWDGFDGGESFRHFYERVTGGIESLLTGEHALGVHEDAGHRLWNVADWDEQLVIVAHEGTVSILVAHLLGIAPNPWTPLRFTCGWTSITRLQTAQLGSGAVWTLESFNRLEHLAQLDADRDGSAPRNVT